jgi:hypothetical protein
MYQKHLKHDEKHFFFGQAYMEAKLVVKVKQEIEKLNIIVNL